MTPFPILTCETTLKRRLTCCKSAVAYYIRQDRRHEALCKLMETSGAQCLYKATIVECGLKDPLQVTTLASN